MAYNTGNPVGSTDPRDLFDNAQDLDHLVNGDEPTNKDRLGKSRKSWAGMEQDFADFLAASEYEFLGDYAAGIEVTAYNQVIRDGGEFWRAAADTELPYTTTGSGMPEGGAFVSVGDAVLRQDLADQSGANFGTDLVGHDGDTARNAINERTIYVGSVAELEALSVPVGTAVYLTENGRSGEGIIKSGTKPSDTLKKFHIGLSDGNYWDRIVKAPINPEWAGATDDGADQSTAIDDVNTEGNTVDLNGKSYTYTGTFSPVAKFYNGKILATNRAFDFSVRTEEAPVRVLQDRARIDYNSPSSVDAFVPESLVMAGFRFFGSYRKPDGRSVATGVDGNVVINDSTDLSILSTRKTENWYAVFAGANESDSEATFVNVPFFRAFSVTGNDITLGEGGETIGENHTQTTYDMATDVMVGADVLVIQQGKKWSGRTTTVTSNTNGVITVDDATGIDPGDFFLVAPPEFDDYVYLGSWYLDTAEPRNRADTGTIVGAQHFQIPDLPDSGALSNYEASVRGMIPPLATAYIARIRWFLSTTSTGTSYHRVSHDGATHNVVDVLLEKTTSNTENYVSAPYIIPFSSRQSLFISTAGGLETSIGGRQFQCYGWIEP